MEQIVCNRCRSTVSCLATFFTCAYMTPSAYNVQLLPTFACMVTKYGTPITSSRSASMFIAVTPSMFTNQCFFECAYNIMTFSVNESDPFI